MHHRPFPYLISKVCEENIPAFPFHNRKEVSNRWELLAHFPHQPQKQARETAFSLPLPSYPLLSVRLPASSVKLPFKSKMQIRSRGRGELFWLTSKGQTFLSGRGNSPPQSFPDIHTHTHDYGTVFTFKPGPFGFWLVFRIRDLLGV